MVARKQREEGRARIPISPAKAYPQWFNFLPLGPHFPKAPLPLPPGMPQVGDQAFTRWSLRGIKDLNGSSDLSAEALIRRSEPHSDETEKHSGRGRANIKALKQIGTCLWNRDATEARGWTTGSPALWACSRAATWPLLRGACIWLNAPLLLSCNSRSCFNKELWFFIVQTCVYQKHS